MQHLGIFHFDCVGSVVFDFFLFAFFITNALVRRMCMFCTSNFGCLPSIYLLCYYARCAFKLHTPGFRAFPIRTITADIVFCKSVIAMNQIHAIVYLFKCWACIKSCILNKKNIFKLK